MTWVLVMTVGLLAGTLGGIVGFGASVVLMPMLVIAFGAKAAVPIMAIAGILGNAARVAVWWREVDWRANAVYCATALPAAVAGAHTLVRLDERLVAAVLGMFFLVMIPLRRRLLDGGMKLGLKGLALVGLGVGYLTGIVASTGPLNTPFFLAYGLAKGAFLGTEALGSALIGLTKAITFRSLGALPVETLAKGGVIGLSLMLGSWAAKWFVLRMDAARFRLIVDVMMAIAGLTLLADALYLAARR